MRNFRRLTALAAAGIFWAATAPSQIISISFPTSSSAKPLDGRVLLLLSNDPNAEPRMQINDTLESQWSLASL
jgi:hypothetical protein